MGKRTIRIPRGKISKQLDELLGKTVQVVMLDGLTHAGLMLSANQDHIVIEDGNAAWTSKKRHQQQLSLPHIYYIAYDIITAW